MTSKKTNEPIVYTKILVSSNGQQQSLFPIQSIHWGVEKQPSEEIGSKKLLVQIPKLQNYLASDIVR